jgi:hypothetical protein
MLLLGLHMRRQVSAWNLAAIVVALLMPAVALPPMAMAATRRLQAPSSSPVVAITESEIGYHGQVVADATPRPCPSDAGQGTFNVDATLERRPWQDNHLGHAYWVEFKARAAWRERAVGANLHAQQRRPGAWRWSTIGVHGAEPGRPYVTHRVFYVRPGYDLWVMGAMAWRPSLATPELTLLRGMCRDPG